MKRIVSILCMSVLLSAAVCALGGNDTGGKINLVWYQWFDAETQKNADCTGI